MYKAYIIDLCVSDVINTSTEVAISCGRSFTDLVHPHQVFPARHRLHVEGVKQLPRLDAAQDEPDVRAGVRHALLLSAHHDLAEIRVDDGGAQALELPDELHEELLHELVDHAAERRLVQQGAGRVNPAEQEVEERNNLIKHLKILR